MNITPYEHFAKTLSTLVRLINQPTKRSGNRFQLSYIKGDSKIIVNLFADKN